MWSPLLVVLLAVTFLEGSLSYVSGPLPMYDAEKLPSSPNVVRPLQNAATAEVPRPLPSLDVTKPQVWEKKGHPPQGSAVTVGTQPRLTGGFRSPPNANRKRPVRVRDRNNRENAESMIHFPTAAEESFSRHKRQIHSGFGPNRQFQSQAGGQGFVNGPQNNFGNSFDYPDGPSQWGGNGNRPNFNGRPQQPNWGSAGGRPGGSPDYEDVPLVFNNSPDPQRPRPSRPSAGTANNRPSWAGNNRPLPGANGQPQQQFPTVTRPPVTRPPVTRAPVTRTTVSPAPVTQRPTMGTTFANCNCPTTPEFNPICGEDRVTYFNPGRLKCSNLCGNNVRMLHFGSCVVTTTAPPAAATTAVAPGNRRREGSAPRRSK